MVAFSLANPGPAVSIFSLKYFKHFFSSSSSSLAAAATTSADGRSFRPSVHPSVHLSLRPVVRPSCRFCKFLRVFESFHIFHILFNKSTRLMAMALFFHQDLFFINFFSCKKQLYKRLCPSVCLSVGPSVMRFSKTANSTKYEGIQVNLTKFTTFRNCCRVTA